jgi:hypothetical protein
MVVYLRWRSSVIMRLLFDLLKKQSLEHKNDLIQNAS